MRVFHLPSEILFVNCESQSLGSHERQYRHRLAVTGKTLSLFCGSGGSSFQQRQSLLNRLPKLSGSNWLGCVFTPNFVLSSWEFRK
jgi:hypothetical protein